jgi:pyruvate-formate lyase-activating enzyme
MKLLFYLKSDCDTIKLDLKYAIDHGKEVGAKTVNLLPFHQFGQKKYSLLNKEYKFLDIAQLHAQDLVEYKEIFIQNGINCTIA